MGNSSRRVQQSKRFYRHSGAPKVTRVPSSVCGLAGKQRYKFRKDALEVLLNIQIRAGITGGSSDRNERRAYKCEECSGWHLTSQSYMRGNVKAV